MSNRKFATFVLFIVAVMIIVYALMFTHSSQLSICHKCGRNREQRWFLFLPTSDSIVENTVSRFADSVQATPCNHCWEKLHKGYDTAFKHFSYCELGRGMETQRAFVELQACLEFQAISDQDARAFLRQIQQTDTSQMEPIRQELEQKLTQDGFKYGKN